MFDVRRIVEDRLVVLVANAGVSKLASLRKRQFRISTACSRSMSVRHISRPAALASLGWVAQPGVSHPGGGSCVRDQGRRRRASGAFAGDAVRDQL